MGARQQGSTPKKTARRSPWPAVFLAALRQRPNVRYACTQAGIDRSTPYRYRETHPEFAEQWDVALREGVEALESEAWRRAAEGTDKPVYQCGELVGTIREYSDTLAIFLLKAHAPEKYRETKPESFTPEQLREACDDAFSSGQKAAAEFMDSQFGLLIGILTPDQLDEYRRRGRANDDG